MKRLKRGSSFIKAAKQKPQLFGQPLNKICADGCSLPKPVTVSLTEP